MNMSKSPTSTTYSLNGQSGSVSDCGTGYGQTSSVTGLFNGTDGSKRYKITLLLEDIKDFMDTLEEEISIMTNPFYATINITSAKYMKPQNDDLQYNHLNLIYQS